MKISHALQKWETTFGTPFNSIPPNKPLPDWLTEALRSYPRCLPRRWPLPNTTTPQCSWYIIAETPRQLREIRDELLAFIGPSFSSFRGLLHSFEQADPLEIEMSRLYEGRTYRIDLPTRYSKEVSRKIELFLKIKQQRPHQTIPLWRLPERILHDFEMALLESNRERSLQLLETIRTSGLFRGTNFTFLELIQAAHFGEWAKLLKHQNINSVLNVLRPRRVTEALLQAIYYTYLHSSVLGQNYSETRRIFDGTVQIRFERLFRRVDHLRQPEALLCFALFIRTQSEIPQPRLDSIRQTLESGEDPEWLALFDQLLGEQTDSVKSPSAPQVAEVETEQRSSFEEIQRLIDDEKTEQAYQRLREFPLSEEVVKQTLFCAEQLKKATVDGDVYELLQWWFDERGEKLPKRFQNYWCRVKENRAKPPSSWLEWAKYLKEAPHWPEAQNVAREICENWHPDEAHFSSIEVKEFADLLEGLVKLSITRYTMSFLTRSFIQGRPQLVWQPIYVKLIEILANQSGLSSDELDALHDLTVRFLESGPAQELYSSTLEWLMLFLDHSSSVSYARWGIALLDPLFYYHCPTLEPREKLIKILLSLCRHIEQQLQPHEIRNLLYYARIQGINEMTDEENWLRLQPKEPKQGVEEKNEPEALLKRLRRGNVGVYTLQEDAAARFRLYIEEYNKNVVVLYKGDKSNSTEIKSFCQNLDFLLVAWNCAKHTATDAIKRHLKLDDSRILYVRGKGSSALISGLNELLQKAHNSSEGQGMFRAT